MPQPQALAHSGRLFVPHDEKRWHLTCWCSERHQKHLGLFGLIKEGAVVENLGNLLWSSRPAMARRRLIWQRKWLASMYIVAPLRRSASLKEFSWRSRLRHFVHIQQLIKPFFVGYAKFQPCDPMSNMYTLYEASFHVSASVGVIYCCRIHFALKVILWSRILQTMPEDSFQDELGEESSISPGAVIRQHCSVWHFSDSRFGRTFRKYSWRAQVLQPWSSEIFLVQVPTLLCNRHHVSNRADCFQNTHFWCVGTRGSPSQCDTDYWLLGGREGFGAWFAILLRAFHGWFELL